MSDAATVGPLVGPVVATIAPAPALPRIRLLQRMLDWSKQPGTQQGLSLLVGGCVLAWLHPFPSAEGIGATLLAASLPRLWPDNTTDAIRTRDLSNAIAHAAATRRPADLAYAAETVAELLVQLPAASSAA